MDARPVIRTTLWQDSVHLLQKRHTTTNLAFTGQYTTRVCRRTDDCCPYRPDRYILELNPAERFGGPLKARVTDRLDPTLGRLEDHCFAASRESIQPAKVAGLIHRWLADQVKFGALALSL